MATKLFLSALVAAIALVSGRLYVHQGRGYASGKSGQISGSESFRWVYLYIRITTFLAAFLAIWLEAPRGLDFYDNAGLAYLGSFISVAGLLIFGAAKKRLGANYSPCFDSFVPSSLTNHGLYRYVRHPIYVGNIVLLIGLAIATGSALITMNAVVTTVYYYLAAVREETALTRALPGYASYMARTGRFWPRFVR